MSPDSSLEPECQTDRKPALGLATCSTCQSPVVGSAALLSPQQPCKGLRGRVSVLLWQMRKLRHGLTELLQAPRTELGLRPEPFKLQTQLSFHSRQNQQEDADRRPVPEPRWRQRSREGVRRAGGSFPRLSVGSQPVPSPRGWRIGWQRASDPFCGSPRHWAGVGLASRALAPGPATVSVLSPN